MYYKFKILNINIEVQGENNFSIQQIEILPRFTILYGDMKLIALEWLYWSISFEFYR